LIRAQVDQGVCKSHIVIKFITTDHSRRPPISFKQPACTDCLLSAATFLKPGPHRALGASLVEYSAALPLGRIVGSLSFDSSHQLHDMMMEKMASCVSVCKSIFFDLDWFEAEQARYLQHPRRYRFERALYRQLSSNQFQKVMDQMCLNCESSNPERVLQVPPSPPQSNSCSFVQHHRADHTNRLYKVA
jgi:hypothetical protein